MKIEANRVVAIDYTLSLDNGETVDSSEGLSPLEFICGKGEIITGLERELVGMEVGEEKNITVPPEEGYGNIIPEAIRMLDRSMFPESIEVGMTFYIKDSEGQSVPFVIKNITTNNVTVDFNHPLAGENLNFKVTIRGIREATDDELINGLIR
jgi:FKBP-type peptidyl-prolyl cis-trans isomerase SlyD